MSSLTARLCPKTHNVICTHEVLSVELLDGRIISVPIVWFPRLSSATQAQLSNWEILGDGEGIHWTDLDEDLSVAGLLAGVR